MTLTDNQKRAMIKRVADALEKLGVAGLAVGIFQGNVVGAVCGIAFIGGVSRPYLLSGALTMSAAWIVYIVGGCVLAAFGFYLLRGLPPKHRH